MLTISNHCDVMKHEPSHKHMRQSEENSQRIEKNLSFHFLLLIKIFFKQSLPEKANLVCKDSVDSFFFITDLTLAGQEKFIFLVHFQQQGKSRYLT